MEKNLYEGGNFGEAEIERLKAMGGFPFEVSSAVLGDDLENKIVFDVGAGPHTALGEYVTGKGGRYIVKDISQKMLDAHDQDYVDWRIAGDIARMPIKDNSVDFTHARLVMMHLPEEKRGQAITEMIRVASDEAIFIENDWNTFEGSEAINAFRDVAIKLLSPNMDLRYGPKLPDDIYRAMKESKMDFPVEKKMFTRERGNYYGELLSMAEALKDMAQRNDDQESVTQLELAVQQIEAESAEKEPTGFVPPDFYALVVHKS